MAILKDLIVLGVSRFIGDITASKIFINGGTSTLFLKADGTLQVLESKAASSNGTDVSLVTTGEKAVWNTKQNALTNPVTGTGLTADKIVLGNGTTTVKTSSKGITTTAPTSTSDDMTIPTSKAVYSAVKVVDDKVNLLEKPVENALISRYTLEQSSNPAFDVINRGAAERYINEMGGYAFLIKDNKVYAAKLNCYDWTKFADGTEFTSALEAATETMIHVPDCHFKASDKTMNFGGLTHIDGGKVFDSPHWVGAYKISYASNIAHSRPGVAPKHSQTMSQFWAAAQLLGSEWGLANYGFHCLINALFQARYANLNSQEVIGPGFRTVTNGLGWEALRDVPMGLTKALGDSSGKVLYVDSNGDNQYPVKLFGFEDLWGKLWEFRPGIRFYMDGQTRKAVVYSGNQVSNTATGREFVCSVQSASGAYVKSMECGEFWDMIAQNVTGGGSTTYYCDGYYAATTGQLLSVGGEAHYGARCGLAYASSDAAFSASHAYIGACLAFYGEPEIISGAELAALAAS